MSIAFTARELMLERTPANLMLGLTSGGPRAGRQHVILMRPLDADDAPGGVLTSEAYFEYTDGRQGGFGCVARVAADGARLTFTCDRRRCPALPGDTFEVTLAGEALARRDEVMTALADLVDARVAGSDAG